MDTSKEYILMCEKAVEIQKTHNQQMCDCQYDKDQDKTFFAMNLSSMALTEPCYPMEIWLPCQDQLQDMTKSNNAFCLAESFVKWVERDTNEDPMSPLFRMRWSMEQLWLAFVMKEKYNKQWTGKDWKKRNE